jgi:hypothetical protein
LGQLGSNAGWGYACGEYSKFSTTAPAPARAITK